MFTALEKFNLSSTELLMIANIKPEAYAQLTPLIVDVHTRYDENQLYVSYEKEHYYSGLIVNNSSTYTNDEICPLNRKYWR